MSASLALVLDVKILNSILNGMPTNLLMFFWELAIRLSRRPSARRQGNAQELNLKRYSESDSTVIEFYGLALCAVFFSSAPPVFAQDGITCESGASPAVILRMDSGQRLSLPPEMLLGNGLEELLEDPDVLCGRTEVLMKSLGSLFSFSTGQERLMLAIGGWPRRRRFL